MMAHSISPIRRTLSLAAAAAIITLFGRLSHGAQWPASSFAAPHPAVVRVVAPERDGISFGSGTLVAANETFGIVLTNWHVVRDASGRVGVVFPNGFRSAATVMRTDRDWDLAALLIWRPPRVQPIPLAAQPPQPGELLTIAGYGSGSYRASAGRCTQFVSPGGNHPYELVELDTPARDGDSGGPILNERGELAGVLFGSAFGRTTGSHSGRVGWFLGFVAGDFQRVTAETQLAQRQSRAQAPPAAINAAANPQPAEPVASEGNLVSEPYSASADTIRPANAPDTPATAADNHAADNKNADDYVSGGVVTPDPPRRHPPLVPPPRAALPAASPPADATLADQIKTVLAIIGAIAVGYQALRLLGRMVG